MRQIVKLQGWIRPWHDAGCGVDKRSERARRAMTHLPEHDPALAALALWCEVVDTPGDTRTSGNRICIGPAFSALPLREQIGLLGHHILHIALRHPGRLSGMAQRRGGLFDTLQFNLAADALVNSVLEAGCHALPRPNVTLATLCRDVLRLPAEDAALAAWDVERLYIALEGLDADGKGRQDSYQQAKEFRTDMERDGQSIDTQADAEWQGHLTRARTGHAAAGRGIGTVLSQLADLPEAVVPWEILLRRLLSKALHPEPRLSHRRPQRRWVAAEAEAIRTGAPAPVFEPGQSRDRRRARIVIGVDTSGSIPPAQLSIFAAEITGVARRSGAEVHLLWFDETVYAQQHLRGLDVAAALQQVEIRRDGGTAFVDVMARAQALDPSIILMLTDMDGVFGTPPLAHVLWVTCAQPVSEPPFGRVLHLDT